MRSNNSRFQDNQESQPLNLPNPEDNLGEQALEALSNKGREASEFLQGLEGDNKYFLTVLNDLYNGLTADLLTLKPTEQERFTILKASIDTLFKPMQQVHEDIEAGKQADEMLKGEIKTKGGLL